MKIDFLKTVNLKNKRRGVVVLSFLVCLILIAPASVAAQLIKAQKRITALQLGDAAEGARVTIVSDSALNDYEAFRRGDRFYVRIPLADLASIPPSFRADGFEDIQVQKVGDGLLVSFGLQAGASARVDQRWNRLDVIFSAPNRTLRNNLANGSRRMTSTNRNPDVAGPMPPGTAPTFSPSGTTYGSGQAFGVREGGVREGGVRDGRNPRLPLGPLANTSRGGNNSPANQSAFGSSAIKSASPFPSPLASPSSGSSSVLSPSSSFPPTTATPATSGTYQPTFGASPAGPVVASDTSSWKARGDAAMKWMFANRLATLLGALILLALIVYLVLALGRRRKNQAKAKRLQAPKVQPKILPTSESEEPSSSPLANSQPRDVSGGRPSAQPSAPPVQPSTSAAAAGALDRSWVRTRPSINSPLASPGDATSEEQEREVFEL
jgi:hypothetical protein